MSDTATAEKPLYKLLGPIYFDDMYIEDTVKGANGPEAVVIEYEGTPNEYMEPMNEPARAQMLKLLAALEAGNRRAGREGNRTPSMDTLVGEAMDNRPRHEMPTRRDDVPPMANTNFDSPGLRFRQPTEKVPSVKIVEQETPIAVKPRRVFGTIVREEPLPTGQET